MTDTIHKKLLNIQRDLKAPKGQYNSFGRYNYRNAEDIMESLKPLLVDNDAVCWCADDYIEHVGDRYYLVATVIFADVETGKEIKVQARAREEETKKGMDGSQITGSASSYARKYALSGLFLIDDNKDADSDEYQNNQNQSQVPRKSNQQSQQQSRQSQGGQPQQSQVQQINQAQYDQIIQAINRLILIKQTTFETAADFYLQKCQVQDFGALTLDKFDWLISHINSQIAKAQSVNNQ